MITNPLPPQAYTKETLTQAFAWLQTQGASIRELATTPDVLVSLYQKAKLNGEASLWPSVQNFKSELKSLAGMMGEFDVATASAPAPAPAPAPSPAQSAPLPASAAAPPTQAPSSKSVAPSLDAKSWSMLVEVKNEFNLSSEQEALRMLISLGYKKIKSL